MRKLKSLHAWQTAQELAQRGYLLSMASELKQHFGMIDQIRRASLSIPANIAEGYALGSTAQFIRCLKIALGSCTELYSHITVLHAVNLVPPEQTRHCLELAERVVAIIIGLIRKLMTRPGAAREPRASRISHPASRSRG